MANRAPIQPFSKTELSERIDRTKRAMAERGLEAVVISSQQNIYYLSGFATKGVSTTKYLVLSADGRGALVIPTIEAGNAERDLAGLPISRYLPYEPAYAVQSPPWKLVSELLDEWSLTSSSVGVEVNGWPAPAWQVFSTGHPSAEFLDISGLIDDLRMVKSDLEIGYLRQAAEVADAVSSAGVEAVTLGATEADVANTMLSAMIAAGGEPPAGLGNVRIGSRTGLVHTGWSDASAQDGDHVYLEFSGAVARYHAVLWRTVFVGTPNPERERLARTMREAHDRALSALRPGLQFRELDAMQRELITEAGFGDQMFPFAGYAVGIALPTSWLGTLIARESERVMEANMTFHMGIFMLKPGEWGMALSQAVRVTESGCEVLSKTDSGPYFK